MSNEGHHEPITEPSTETKDTHRGLTSLMEELEATDWYNQRVDASLNKELAAILMHNSNEENRHVSMLLECIREKDTSFIKELKSYLFSDKPKIHG